MPTYAPAHTGGYTACALNTEETADDAALPLFGASAAHKEIERYATRTLCWQPTRAGVRIYAYRRLYRLRAEYGKDGAVPSVFEVSATHKEIDRYAMHTGLSLCVGTYLSSRAASSQVLSAPVSLTAVFGMGTGVPSPSSAPTISIRRTLRPQISVLRT